jgi:NADH:ubiquinone oxidoreductase subunit 5 (subunit L)/multisubunit Na+/H+ antiporter MnhA subunit
MVNGAATVVDVGSRMLRRMQTGYVQNYALAMAIGLFALLGIWLFMR